MTNENWRNGMSTSDDVQGEMRSTAMFISKFFLRVPMGPGSEWQNELCFLFLSLPKSGSQILQTFRKLDLLTSVRFSAAVSGQRWDWEKGTLALGQLGYKQCRIVGYAQGHLPCTVLAVSRAQAHQVVCESLAPW